MSAVYNCKVRERNLNLEPRVLGSRGPDFFARGNLMPISVSCSCGRKLLVGDQLPGKTGPCPTCGRPIQIPALDSAPAAESASAQSEPLWPAPGASDASPPSPFIPPISQQPAAARPIAASPVAAAQPFLTGPASSLATQS